ncbi:MAG: FAD-binding oxidoreductase [Rhodospirillaceae bacterium]|nr:FAD-binding oxidoreductase [Rhodospirillaceae bacterium]MCY4067353.1 FAD-binding oxidoreductase [Rhodospirillaceae bacterium]
MTRGPADAALLDRLRVAAGDASVTADPERLASLSHDIAGPAGALPVCIVAPDSLPALQRAVAASAENGYAVVPRGGGMSYTGGYAPSAEGCVLFDMSRLTAVAEIDTANRHAIVEAGCTWATLHDALRGTGFRPPSFGPLSGGVSTVGGAVSHNAMFFGSGSAGGIAGSVLGLEVVLSDGRLLHTGALRPEAVDALPHGPDPTGLFVGDCGAFGIKARVALRLAPVAGGEAFLSMAFDDPLAMLDAQTALAGRPGLGECFSFDRQAHRNILDRRIGFREKLGAVSGVARGTGGLARAARLPAEGLGFLEHADYSLHLSVEGDDPRHAAARAEALRAELAQRGGTDLPDTIPRVTRVRPFGPITALLGPRGENWLPVHGALGLARAAGCMAALRDRFQTAGGDMAEAGVTYTVLTVLAPRCVLVEPQFFWPDRLSPFHVAHATPEQVKLYREAPENPRARALVFELRNAAAEILQAHGAAHMQIGRYYPLLSRLTPAQADIHRRIRAALDPDGRMNPGVLEG